MTHDDFKKYSVIRHFVDDVPTLTEVLEEESLPINFLPLPTAPKLAPLLPEVIDSSWGEWDEAVSRVDADPEVIQLGVQP